MILTNINVLIVFKQPTADIKYTNKNETRVTTIIVNDDTIL